MKTAISTDRVAAPVAPYSTAIISDGLIVLSGQVGLDPTTGGLVDGDVAAQLSQALRNVEAVLEAAGKSLDDVIKVGLYLTDMGDFKAVNEVYAAAFSEPYPARTAIGVNALPLGAAVEIDVIAR
jgi:2-iminobutanoate/2-iminopropanoate deaminase